MKNMNRNKGNTIIILVVFLLAITLSVVFNVSGTSLKESARVSSWIASHETMSHAESAVEDVAVRIKNGVFVPETVNVLVGDSLVPVLFRTVADMSRQIVATGTVRQAVRAIDVRVADVPGGDFGYAVQVGSGGMTMANSSDIRGGIVSAGPVSGTNSSVIRGDVFSTGPGGRIEGIHATGTARAHSIVDSQIDKDAYYQTIQNTTVGGTKYPGSSDLPSSPLPLTDEEIEQIKTRASVHVITSPCPYLISGSDSVTIGPAKIMCDLQMKNTSTLTLTGDVWVVGNISFENSSKVKMSSDFGTGSVAMIAEDPSNYVTSGTINLANGTVVSNSGTDGSYVVFIAKNRSAAQGGDTTAINVGNTARGELVAYAPDGKVVLANSNEIRAVTGYGVVLANSANISYRNPLKSLYFSEGTGRGWSITSWKEIE